MEDIAYVGADMRLHLARADGSGSKPIEAPGSTHAWPAWSPAGKELAFSGFSSGSNGSGLIALYLQEPGDGSVRLLYANQPGTDAIAQRTPHYVLWSPDGRRLALIARTNTPGLTLFVVDPSEPGRHTKVVNGMPVFVSWSPDSRFLLVHSGRDHHLLDLEDDARVKKMPGGSGLYMAPSWSPAANRMAVLRQGEGTRQTLLIDDVEEGSSAHVAEVDGSAAFAWSPGGDRFAIVRDPRGGSRLYDGLWVVNADGSDETRLTGDPVLCFFWSPAGSQIAYVTPSTESRGSLRWGVVQTETGSLRHLADFRPTEEQLTSFMFFDQYVQSHNPWSRGGERLIFSGATGAGKESAALPGRIESSVLVLDPGGAGEPVPVAEGVFGCWSRG